MTRFLHGAVLYVALLKYVSLSLTVPCVICSPDIQIDAIPSQPLKPYLALHTSPRPTFGLHAFGFLRLLPCTIAVSNTDERLQSAEARVRDVSHTPETLSPSFTENGFDVRAQWYGPHVWSALTKDTPLTPAKIITAPMTAKTFFFITIFIINIYY